MMLNRRSSLRAAPAAGAVLAVPALAIAEAKPVMTPDERIDAALAEIVIALRERYPNCPVRIDEMDNFDQGCLVIATHCGEDQPGQVNFRRRKLDAAGFIRFGNPEAA